MSDSESIALGHVSGVFGIKGWIKVYSYTRPKEQILNYPTWLIGKNKTVQMILEEGRLHKESIIAKLKGIDDRNKAMDLFENKIHVLTQDLANLPQDEFYWYQLIGLQVFDTSGKHIGEVVRMMETGANDVLVVRADDKAEHLIPYIKDGVIQSIDLMTQKIIVEWETNY